MTARPLSAIRMNGRPMPQQLVEIPPAKAAGPLRKAWLKFPAATIVFKVAGNRD